MRIPSLKMLSLGVVSLLPVACVYDPVYYGPPPHVAHPVYYQPWGYYYYPGVNVYFRYSTGFYFYFSDGIWIRTRVLPPYIHLDPRDRVHLHIESDKPYLYHQRHVEQYKPRPIPRPTPQQDKLERERNLEWYHEQRDYREKYKTQQPPGAKTDKRKPKDEEDKKRRR